METNRQKKIAGVLQKDLADVLQHAAQDGMKRWILEFLLLVLVYSIIALLWKQDKTWQFYALSMYAAISLSDDIFKLLFLKNKKK